MGFLFKNIHIDCVLMSSYSGSFTACSLYFKLEDKRYDAYILKSDLTQGVFNLLFLKRFKLHQTSKLLFKTVILNIEQLEDFLLCFELVFHSNIHYISYVTKFTELSKEEILKEFEKVQKYSKFSEITPII